MGERSSAYYAVVYATAVAVQMVPLADPSSVPAADPSPYTYERYSPRRRPIEKSPVQLSYRAPSIRSQPGIYPPGFVPSLHGPSAQRRHVEPVRPLSWRPRTPPMVSSRASSRLRAEQRMMDDLVGSSGVQGTAKGQLIRETLAQQVRLLRQQASDREFNARNREARTPPSTEHAKEQVMMPLEAVRWRREQRRREEAPIADTLLRNRLRAQPGAPPYPVGTVLLPQMQLEGVSLGSQHALAEPEPEPSLEPEPSQQQQVLRWLEQQEEQPASVTRASFQPRQETLSPAVEESISPQSPGDGDGDDPISQAAQLTMELSSEELLRRSMEWQVNEGLPVAALDFNFKQAATSVSAVMAFTRGLRRDGN